MSWGSTLHAAAFFAALAIVFLYLHREYRLPHHLLWLLAWAFLVVRALVGLLRIADDRWLALDAGLVVVSSSLLLLGALSAAGPERLGRSHAMRVGAAIGAGFVTVFAVLVSVRPGTRSAT